MIIRRLLNSLLLLLVMSFVTFLFIHLAPGNFFDSLKMDPQVSPETIARYEAAYGLDKPFLLQYAYWLRNLLRLDLGYSFFYNAPVTRVLSRRLFNTFILSLSSLLLTWLVALPLGIYAAVNRGRWPDKLLFGFSFVGLSVPGFFLALLLLYLLGLSGILPLGGMRSIGFSSFGFWGKIWDIARHLVIPTLVISLAAIAGLQRIVRANLLDVLRQQYIVFARAKGLPEGRVIYLHALRNAVNPLVTIFGYHLSALLSGSALIEIICGWPGLGAVMLTAVRSQDIYLVMGGMLMGGVLLLLGNLFADLLLLRVDPRITDIL
ncbi:MAG: ABC transporter permease [Candidatus Omnitrophota bacterium]